MKSGKQRRAELDARKQERIAKETRVRLAKELASRERHLARSILVNAAALAPNNSYGVPDFVERCYYVDEPFECMGCGVAEVWTATQQKWWYEVAKGYAFSSARRCRACRRKERKRVAEARRIQLEGKAKKLKLQAKPC